MHMCIRREWYEMVKDTDTDTGTDKMAKDTDKAFNPRMCCWDVAKGCLCSNPKSNRKYYEEVQWPDLWVHGKLQADT